MNKLKNSFLKARGAQNGGFGTGQEFQGRAWQGQQLMAGQFQNHEKVAKGAGSSKWWFWNWSRGQGRTGRAGREEGRAAGQGRAGQAKYFDSGMVHLIACAEQWDALAWAAMEGLGLAGARAPIAQLSRSSLTHF